VTDRPRKPTDATRPNPGAFKPGWHPTHDVSAAGRKGKSKSPWRNGYAPEKVPRVNDCGGVSVAVSTEDKR
jgi:hypothetical protein